MLPTELKFVSRLVKQVLQGCVARAFPAIKPEILLQNEMRQDYEYITPVAIKEFNVNKDKKTGTSFGFKTLQEFAQHIVDAMEPNGVIRTLKANEKGFIQVWLADELIEGEVNQLLRGIHYPEVKKQRVIVDFSSPNIAKEMHVGHLRSTIIGESMCRMLEFMGHDVHRVNHLGDWGTQFGMLIAYMNET